MRAKLLLALCLSAAAFSQQKKILFMGEGDMLTALQSASDKAKIVPVTTANVMQELADADAFIGTIKPEYVRAGKNLKWTQIMSAGVETMRRCRASDAGPVASADTMTSFGRVRRRKRWRGVRPWHGHAP